MTTEYIYRTVDLKSNLVLEDIDLQGVSFSTVLNNVGSLSGNLYVPQSAKGFLLDAATEPGRTGLYVFRNGVPVWGGIIWKRDWDEESSSFTLTCGSWESYAYHRVQSMDKTYAQVDQLTIARDLVNFTIKGVADPDQDTIPQETGIVAPPGALSGFLRDRSMFDYEQKTVGLELEQLSNLEKGFDYYVQSVVNSDMTLGRQYVFGYPRLGRAASADPAANSLTFEYPGNLRPFKLTEDSETGGWWLFSIGAGEGVAAIRSIAHDDDYGVAGWPRLDVTTQYSDVSVQGTLDSHANADLARNLPPIDSWTFDLSPTSDVWLDDFSIGDSAVFRLNSRRWPTTRVIVRRIVQISVTPGDHGELEKVTLGLGDDPE